MPNPRVAMVGFFIRTFTRQWKLAIVPLLIGMTVSLACAWTFGKRLWESTGTMLYTPLPLPDGQKGLYTSPDFTTLTSLIKSRDNLKEICEEFDLSMPTTTLDKLFKITTTRNIQTVSVSLQWRDAETGTNMTNRLMERFIDRSLEFRHNTADGHIRDLSQRLGEINARHAKAAEGYARFLREHNIFDIKLESVSIGKELETLVTVQSQLKRDDVASLAQRDRIILEFNEYKKKEQEESEKERKFEASMESVADNRRRQDRLRELIDDERKRQEWVAELSLKRKEYERKSQLRQHGAVSKQELDEAAKEVEILTAKLNDNAKITAWRDELTKIDQVVIPKGQTRSQGSPIVQQTLFRQLEIDLKLIGIQKELFEVEKSMNEKRRRQEEITTLVRESDAIQKELETIDLERTKLTDQESFFKRLRQQTVSEFAIIAPARINVDSISSNRKTWFMGGMVLTLLVAFSRMTWNEFQAEYHAGRSLVRRAGTDVLGILNHETDMQRRFCTRLRDFVPAHSGVVVFTGDETAQWEWAVRSARRLAARDERVLVVDCRVSTPSEDRESMPGLGDFLSFRVADIDNLIFSDETTGLDILPAGGHADPDAIATHRMAEFLNDVRKRYTMVFLVGQPMTMHDEVDLLARYADGLVAVFGRKGSSRSEIRPLADLGKKFPGRVRAAFVE
ncbi:MAG: hypothetical protein U0798_05085 [Gemmataceae bacterium]